jgi:Mu-like prophage tail sheath protein gpL
MPYVVADRSLPRSLDVQISLSRPQTETRTLLNIMCVACEDLGFLPDASRVRFYSTIEAVEEDFAPGTEAHFAASAFFAQTPRATTMAIGEVFLDAQPGQLVMGSLGASDIATLELIVDGNLELTIGGTGYDVNGITFDGVSTLAGIASAIQTAITTAAAPATCAVRTFPGGDQRVVITSTATGDAATMAFPITTGTGTFLGTALKATEALGGKALNGYTPAGIADELSSILNAANMAGKFLYGWCLGASLRDASIQEDAAAWALARTAIMPLVTNDALALDSTYDEDLASVVYATGNRRAVLLYHDNPQRYPDVSILAYMLHVNYQLINSTVTAKFKELPGVETVQLTETEWSILQEKGYNTYTAVGNDSRTYRDGTTGAPSWYMDTVINLDNFVEDLSVAVYNVFLRNKKVPYTRLGQMLLVDACRDVGAQYTYNGTFADREIPDAKSKSGVAILPAVGIFPTPISQMSVADRASRIGPPIQLTVQEAGAIHSVAINVDVVS